MNLRRFAVALCVLALLVSLGLNGVLLRASRDYYQQLNAIRLAPLGLSHYPLDADPLPGSRNVVFFGDSRAAEWPAPEGLEGWTFANRGIHNQTSAEVLHRFDAHVAPLEPDVVVIQVGINDLKAIPLFPGQRAEIVANCQANIAQIVARSRELGATVILTTLFPLGKVPLERRLFWSGEIEEAQEEVNDFLHTLAGEGIIVLDTAPILADGQGVLRRKYSRDLLHLTEAGYQALNAALVPVLETPHP
jgi:lysophospholipase L1-like esterase